MQNINKRFYNQLRIILFMCLFFYLFLNKLLSWAEKKKHILLEERAGRVLTNKTGKQKYCFKPFYKAVLSAVSLGGACSFPLTRSC